MIPTSDRRVAGGDPSGLLFCRMAAGFGLTQLIGPKISDSFEAPFAAWQPSTKVPSEGLGRPLVAWPGRTQYLGRPSSIALHRSWSRSASASSKVTMRALNAKTALQNLPSRLDLAGRPFVGDMAVIDGVGSLGQVSASSEILLHQDAALRRPDCGRL
jgi:hypothetical protein